MTIRPVRAISRKGQVSSSGSSGSSTAKAVSRSAWLGTPPVVWDGRCNGTVIGAGRLIVNNRSDNHRGQLLRLSVKSRRELVTKVVPFFERNPLRTIKRRDFELFARVLEAMQRREHLTIQGLVEIASLTERMNRRQRSRFLESSEAIRQPTRSRQPS